MGVSLYLKSNTAIIFGIIYQNSKKYTLQRMSAGGWEKTQMLSDTKIYNVHKNIFECLGWNRIKKNVFSPLGISELLQF
jgi:hypothetical protein